MSRSPRAGTREDKAMETEMIPLFLENPALLYTLFQNYTTAVLINPDNYDEGNGPSFAADPHSAESLERKFRVPEEKKKNSI